MKIPTTFMTNDDEINRCFMCWFYNCIDSCSYVSPYIAPQTRRVRNIT